MSEPAPTTPSTPAPDAAPPAAPEPIIPKEEPAPLSAPPPKDVSPPAAELKYEFKAPEGYDTKEIEAFAKEHKLAPEVAQKVLEREIGSVSKYVESQKAEFEKIKNELWVKEVYSDPELGGKNIDKTRANVMNVWQELPKPVRDEIVKAGFENNPLLVKILNFVGSRSKEPKFVQPQTEPTSKTQGRPTLESVYGSIHNKA